MADGLTAGRMSRLSIKLSLVAVLISIISLVFGVFLTQPTAFAQAYGQGSYNECSYQACESDANNPGSPGSTSSSEDLPGTPNTGGWFGETKDTVKNVYQQPTSYWWVYVAIIFILLLLLIALLRRRKSTSHE